MPGPSEALRLFISNVGSRSCLDVRGELDLGSVDDLGEHLDLLVASGTGDVAVDMAAVTFCDATSLRVLVAAHQSLHAAGRQFQVVNPSERVTRLLLLTALDTVLLATPHRIGTTSNAFPTGTNRCPRIGVVQLEGSADADR